MKISGVGHFNSDVDMTSATKICKCVLAESSRSLIYPCFARLVCLMCLAESLTLVICDQVLREGTRNVMSHFFILGCTARTNSQE